MSPSNEEDNMPDLAGAIQNARAAAEEAGEDPDKVDVVAARGLDHAVSQDTSGELPYVVLLKAAVNMVKSEEISIEEYVEGVKKLDVIADNALKVYSIPTVKNDLPGKLTEHQNDIVFALEEEIHNMKEGLGILLGYPDSLAVSDLDEGLHIAVSAMNEIANIQKAADEEQKAIAREEEEDKARRAQQAAAAEAEA